MKKRTLRSIAILLMTALVLTMMPLSVSAASKNPGKAKIKSFKVGKVSKKNSTATVTIRWKRVAKATGYEVWTKHGTEEWVRQKKVGRLRGGLRLKKVPSGQVSFKVRAIRKVKGKVYYGKYSKVKTKFIKSPLSLENLGKKYPKMKDTGDPNVKLDFSGNTAIVTMDLKGDPSFVGWTVEEVKSISGVLYNELGSPDAYKAASQTRDAVKKNSGVSSVRVRFVYTFNGKYITARDY